MKTTTEKPTPEAEPTAARTCRTTRLTPAGIALLDALDADEVDRLRAANRAAVGVGE